jgi:hypothetical protein
MSQSMQPLTCKKCGRGGFYHLQPGETRGKWGYLDNYDNVQAFEPPFDVPHWSICPATTKGHEKRQALESEMTEFVKREYQKREDRAVEKVVSHPPEQTRLPSERLTSIDREIAAKISVMELILDDIKRLIGQKAADI